MKKQNILALTFAFLLPLMSFAAVSPEVKKVADNLGATKAIEISFDEGKSNVTSNNLEAIKVAVDEVGMPVKEVKVIAWADREYPATGEKASKVDVTLADERAKNIKKYINDNLKIKGASVYNMAKRPNTLEELLQTSEKKVKDKLESTGTAPTTKEGTGFMGLSGKKSTAIVLIYAG